MKIGAFSGTGRPLNEVNIGYKAKTVTPAINRIRENFILFKRWCIPYRTMSNNNPVPMH
jgi:hypothetical protein